MWHNNLNQLTVRARWEAAPGQEENFYHNYNGCMTNDDTYIYAYNAENRLVETRSSLYKYNYYYDGLGRKIKTVIYKWQAVGKPPVPQWVEQDTYVYHYDGWNCITESDLSGSTLTIEKTYVWGSDFSGTLQGAGSVGGLITVKLEDDPRRGLTNLDYTTSTFYL
jgi:YD repeat-containing protein